MKQITKNNLLLIEGIIYSNFFALVCFAVAYGISNWDSEVGSTFIFSEFVLVPMSMGIMAMKFWCRTEKRLINLLPYAILNTIIAIALSGMFMGEGYICLIIVSPLVLGFMWGGVILGKYIFGYNKKTLKTTTFQF